MLGMHGHGQGQGKGIRGIHPCQGQYGAWVCIWGDGTLEKSSMHGCPPGRSGEMHKIRGRRNEVVWGDGSSNTFQTLLNHSLGCCFLNVGIQSHTVLLPHSPSHPTQWYCGIRVVEGTGHPFHPPSALPDPQVLPQTP